MSKAKCNGKNINIIDINAIDLSKKISRAEYEIKIKSLQLELLPLQLALKNESKKRMIITVEGWDAAGKGGSIKRLVERLDPRGYKVYSIAAPEPNEQKRHYMYRFWTKLPLPGEIVVFDRSWYGRVLVEKIEEFAKKEEVKRAYEEINSFEKILVKDEVIVLKFWFQISKEEQLKRFTDRKLDPLKSWKLTEEDWRNRERWSEYEDAAQIMFEKTHTKHCPWHIIESNNKKYARIKFIQTVIDVLKLTLCK